MSVFKPDDDAVIRISNQLAVQRSATIKPSKNPVPNREQLASLIEMAFWASLKSNEGRATRICIGVGEKEAFSDAMAFANQCKYDVSEIVKLAPAVPQGGCLHVSAGPEGLVAWGFGRSRPESMQDTLTIEASAPGVVRVGVGPFQPFAVLGQSTVIMASTRTELAHR